MNYTNNHYSGSLPIVSRREMSDFSGTFTMRQMLLGESQTQGRESPLDTFRDHFENTNMLQTESDLSTYLTPEKIKEPIFMVPFDRNSKFIDRPELFEHIDYNVESHMRVVLRGRRGMGKTEMAIEYCYEYRDKNPNAHVFWVCGASLSQFRKSYGSIAYYLGLPCRHYLNFDPITYVNDWLADSENGPWLMVVDAVDDFNACYELGNDNSRLLPKSLHGSLIITVVDKGYGQLLADQGGPTFVGPMNCDESMKLFRAGVDRSHDDERDILDLLDALEHIPLDIIHSAAFIRETNTSIQEYMQIMNGRPSRSTWKPSFSYIMMQNSLAGELLCLIASMDILGVPKFLVMSHLGSDSAFASTIAILKGFSLLRPLCSGEVFAIHSHVRYELRRWLDLKGCTTRVERKVLKILANRFPRGDWKNHEICAQLYPTACRALDYDCIDNDESKLDHARLLTNVASFETWTAKYEGAHSKLCAALAIRNSILGPNHPETLTTTRWYADILLYRGIYRLAERTLIDAAERSENALGLEDPLTRAILILFAESLEAVGKFVEAKTLLLEMLKNGTHILENAAIDTPKTHASVYDLEGDHHNALIWTRRALAASLRINGNHPATFEIYDHLGEIYLNMNRLEDAEISHRQALTGREAVLGHEHHLTLLSTEALAEVLRRRGEREEAAILYYQALVGLSHLLGHEHRHALRCKLFLARALDRGTQYDRVKMAREAVEGIARSYGADYPEVDAAKDIVEEILEEERRLDLGNEVDDDEVRQVQEEEHGLHVGWF